MLMYIWMCVALNAFMPGGDRIATHYVQQMQGYMRAQIETIEPVAAPARPTQRVRQARSQKPLAR